MTKMNDYLKLQEELRLQREESLRLREDLERVQREYDSAYLDEYDPPSSLKKVSNSKEQELERKRTYPDMESRKKRGDFVEKHQIPMKKTLRVLEQNKAVIEATVLESKTNTVTAYRTGKGFLMLVKGESVELKLTKNKKPILKKQRFATESDYSEE